jgi:hypothetical protein
MSTTANLTGVGESIINGNDNIVIVDNFQSIRGGRTLDVTGFSPKVIRAGHVIIRETATKVYKPMPATDTTTDGVATTDTLVAGTGYTNGVYENVPLVGGTGSGVLATVTVAGTVVTVVTITYPGNGYVVGDVLLVPGAFAGGTQTTSASVRVATVGTTSGVYGALPSGHTYAGILIASILTVRPFAGIMVRGTVNELAAPYSMTSIIAAVKTALPLIDFRSDIQ